MEKDGETRRRGDGVMRRPRAGDVAAFTPSPVAPSPRPSSSFTMRRMWKRVLAGLWRGTPLFVRRAGVWLTQPRFRVTAGAVVCDERGRVLLLKHVLRKGSGWGVPGLTWMPGVDPDPFGH